LNPLFSESDGTGSKPPDVRRVDDERWHKSFHRLMMPRAHSPAPNGAHLENRRLQPHEDLKYEG
jgi:hypothetical protein